MPACMASMLSETCPPCIEPVVPIKLAAPAVPPIIDLVVPVESIIEPEIVAVVDTVGCDRAAAIPTPVPSASPITPVATST